VHTFNATTFVIPGAENDPGEWPDDDVAFINGLREIYPELKNWGNLALGGAWGQYSQEIYAISWVDFIDGRDNGFLAFIYIRNKCKKFDFGGTDLFREDIIDYSDTLPWEHESQLPEWVTRELPECASADIL